MTNSVEPPLPVRTGRTRSDCRAMPVSHNQVRQREQHIQFGGLFWQTSVSRFSIPELPLYDRKYVFYLSSYRRLLMLRLLCSPCPLADSFLIRVGLRFCLYLIFLPCLFRTMASCRFSTPIYPLSPYNSLLVQKRYTHLFVHTFIIIAHSCPIFNAFALRGGALR